jgi:hypothetical protein
VADGASLAILAAGAASSSAPLAIVGVAGWFLASPVVHVSHAGVGRGLGSLALRIGLPVVGILIANIASDGCWREPGASDNCDTAAQAEGLLLGAVAAEVLDVAWLARDARPVEPAPHGSDHPFAQLVVSPAVGGASVGLVGRF